ncbi:phospholipid scramblase 1-like [Puntigrus tetrazona]|uniref:phospholipid scramblase 1-like n=1 Tax=Puntigrus tetrazona TaxID=1606681 RepID=UPI001C8ACB4F|nr:phospholipid scramblase 1-like [Puntigrus tetrazona]
MELSENTALIPSSVPYPCPSHLETLNTMDQLFVYKEETVAEHLAEVCCGIKPVNSYFVTDGTGNKVFSILEDSDCGERCCCGGGRFFTMNVTDHSNLKVIRLVHPSVCCCASHELEVQSPPGIAIGYIRQNWYCCLSKFTVENERGEPAFKINRPFDCCISCMDHNYELLSLNEEATERPFGNIIRSSSCCGSNADFVLRFPRNLDVKMKATLMGACVLIDYVNYQTSHGEPLIATFISLAFGYLKMY